MYSGESQIESTQDKADMLSELQALISEEARIREAILRITRKLNAQFDKHNGQTPSS
jgi:hypothetical protein